MSFDETSTGFARALSGFLGWWANELAEMVPGWLRRALDPPLRKVALAIDDDGFRIIDQRPNGTIRIAATIPKDASAPAALADAFSKLALVPGQGVIGVRLPMSVFLERQIELPRAARNRAVEILAFELERSTPFRSGQVYSTHYFGDLGADNTRVVAHQVIAKRETIDRAVDFAEALGLEVQFADAYRDDPEVPIPIDFLRQSTAPSPKPSSLYQTEMIMVGLAASLVVLNRPGFAGGSNS